MNDLFDNARLICHAYLNSTPKDQITDEKISEIIDQRILSAGEFSSIDSNTLFESIRSDLSIGKGEITILSDEIKPWLNEARNDIKFELWARYKLYMKKRDPSFPVNDLDDYTDKILDRCVNPQKTGSWDRRGMVVGHVQSGKTSNYIGLINKATDAGYKIIIIIAGTISSLRRQTQERVDEGYVGRSSSDFIRGNQTRKIGVGHYETNTDIYSLTSSYYKSGDEGDFSQAVANRLNIPLGKNPIVFVIKKNKSILENLIDWFSKDINTEIIDGSPKLFNAPALIIDDEADAASVNTAKDINEAKTINRLIRTLLNLFNQNTFIGYTATPYANLFIPQDFNDELTTTIKGKEYRIGEDLFPRDFIINIKAPSNYIGAAKIFGYENPIPELTKEPLDIFREIDDYDPPFYKTINKDNKFDLPEYLPPSLEKAIKSFILTCAIRRLRGHENKHNSMLVHVALLVAWIDRVASLISEKTKEIQLAISANDEQIMRELEELYSNDFIPTTQNVIENLGYKDIRIKQHDWAEVKKELRKAASKIEVRAVHGKKSISDLEYHHIEEIDYKRHEKGLSVIAVGGTRLSRGITLEGLSVSYYLRTTKMYDSLMQMGRWFGYRPGYADLCRLFTTETIFEWFNHITLATEEMRNDFDEMTVSHQRPKDFRLKVRNHHGLLTITSVSKLRFAEKFEISFSGTNPQTYQLLKIKAAIKNNFNAFNNLISTIGFPKEENRIRTISKEKIRYLFYPNQNIDAITDFLDSYQIDQPSIKNATLSDYIRKQHFSKTINEWSICVISNTDEDVFIAPDNYKKKDSRKANTKAMKYNLKWGNEVLTLGCSVRNQPSNTRSSPFYLIAKNQIDDLKDRQVDLKGLNLDTNLKIKVQRAIEKKGLLLLYALDERGTPNVNNEIPIIGYSIHFPKIDNERKVSYTATPFKEFEDEPMEDDEPEIE